MKLRAPGAFSLFRTRVARRMLLAMLLAALLPLTAAALVAFALLEFSIGVGLNQTVQEALDDDLPLYGALFDAKKAEYRAAGRAMALKLPRNRALAEGDLRVLLLEHPEVARVALTSLAPAQPVPDGGDADGEEEEPEVETRLSVAATPLPLGRPFAVGVPLDDTRVLKAEFHLPPRFDEGLARAQKLSETYAAVTRARGAITRGLLMIYGAVVLLVLLGAAILAGLIARSITRKVVILASAARKAAKGNLEVRVEEHWQDELGDLARAFNKMLAEIAEGRERIVYLEKISGWQDVARRLAHEIKNPLTPMVLAVQELAEKVPAQPESYARLVRTAREIVEEEASTLRRLVQEFSEFARLPDVRPEPTDVVALVQEFVEGAKDIGAVAELRVEAPGGELLASVDRGLMRRVLRNLVCNAVEAQGIRVAAEVALPEPGARRPVVVVRARPLAAGWVALDVEDDGPGVPVPDRARVFEPYVTTKQHGTGLGLSIVKKIVLQHGGTITLAGGALGGASVQIRLPGLEVTASQPPLEDAPGGRG
jgi:nitrogen fixation/metabolism regulation signal transduction histidine kinase